LNKTRLKETLNLFYELSTFHESEGMEFITDNELNKLKEATNVFRGLSKEELTQKLGTDTAANSMLKLFEEMESGKVTVETLNAAMVDF
jgi:hypothetical protein